jgi:hypothetical protein
MTPEEIERLRKLKAEKEAKKNAQQAPNKPVQKTKQEQPSSSSVMQDLKMPPMPLAVQDATNPENVDIKGGSTWKDPNPLLTAASFVAPLAVDEIETHGFDRPFILGAKATGDAAMMAVPATKVAGAGFKIAGAGMKAGNRFSRVGNFMTKPWISMNTGTRIGGQAAANAMDNAIYSGIQIGLDNRERDFSEALAEMAIGTGIGGITGGVGGLSSKNSAINFENHLHKKTKAKQGSVKDREFEMLDRFNDENLTKSEQVANLITDHPLNENFPYLPPTWSQLDQNYQNAIENKLKEANVLSKSEIGQITTTKIPVEVEAVNGKFYPVGVDTENGIKIQEPIFNKQSERQAFINNVNDFLTTNSLGTYNGKDGLIHFNEGVLPADVEAVLKKSRQGNFTTKGLERRTSHSIKRCKRR